MPATIVQHLDSGPTLADAKQPPHSERQFLSATTEDIQRLTDHLAAPPPADGTPLSPAQYRAFVSEVRELVHRTLDNPRPVHTNTINSMVAPALEDYLAAKNDPGWRLTEITEELRTKRDGKHIFGQIHDKQGQSIFVGRWSAERDTTERALGFEIDVKAEVRTIEPANDISQFDLSNLKGRDAQPWTLQVPPSSPLGKWAAEAMGTKTTGFLSGFQPLGVFSEAIAHAAAEAGLSNILLPRSRRDPGTKPWHVGDFLHSDGRHFTWSDLALDRDGRPVKPVITVTPVVKILDVGPPHEKKHSN